MSKRIRNTGRTSKKVCKNAVLDSLVIIIVLMVMSIVGVFAYNIFDELNTEIQTDTEMGEQGSNVSSELYGKYPNLIDNLFLMAFVMFVVFIMVSVFMIDTHPIFFVISLILLICVFVVAMLLGNVHEELMQDSAISSYANDLTYMSWVTSHLVEIIVAVAVIGSIVLYIKLK